MFDLLIGKKKQSIIWCELFGGEEFVDGLRGRGAGLRAINGHDGQRARGEPAAELREAGLAETRPQFGSGDALELDGEGRIGNGSRTDAAGVRA